MDLSRNTCSRELAEEMERIGICQNGWELCYVQNIDSSWEIQDGWSVELKEIKYIIAPTLARMMEELPKCGFEMWRLDSGEFEIMINETDINESLFFQDKHLPNAVAKALIAIKKGAI